MKSEDIKVFRELADIYVQWADSCTNPAQATTLRIAAYQIYTLYIGIQINRKGFNSP